jgi:5-methylcytosine-specific restriction protein B
MSNTANSLSPEFKKLLTKYVDDFIVRVTSGSTSQVPITLDPAFSLACKELNIWFKTSFGHGNLAAIPWLACFAPGQSAQLEGVYPVLLFERATSTASVNYGVSATAVEASGAWPREWPRTLTDGSPTRKGKKQYKQSFVVKEFVNPSRLQTGEIASVLLKIIAEFIELKEALADRPGIDFSTLTEFANGSSDAGLTFPDQVMTRFISSLLTKRFCILTGLAGSGKTKLAEAFAMWLCESDLQYRIVAVGADWTSNENLLGYADALQAGQYRAPVNGALELILRASKDADKKPYFLILDEMNLSHVERYFADFLSAMESDNAPLSLHGAATDLAPDGTGAIKVPAKVALPPNLFIIGTVNVDETTYMFSPKVLDRANVIEFRATAEQMGSFLDNPSGIDLDVLRAQGVPFAAAFVQRALDDADITALTDDAGNSLGSQFKSDLMAVFAALATAGAEFGFRTAKEIARFMVLHKELSGTGWVYKDALDAQVLQKLMPKLHGSARKLSGVLKALEEFSTTRSLTLTQEKVKRMQQRLERDGFTSFAEA